MVKTVRLAQLIIFFLVVVGLGWGVRQVRWEQSGETLIRWVPASSEEISLGAEQIASSAVQMNAPPLTKPLPENALLSEQPAPQEEADQKLHSAEELLAAKLPAETSQEQTATPQENAITGSPVLPPAAEEEIKPPEILSAASASPDATPGIVSELKTEEPPPPSWNNARVRLLEPVIILLAREKQSFWGLRINDLVVGRLLDNGTALQRGELAVLAPYLDFLSNASLPPGNKPAESLRQNVVEADLSRFWFTSAETRLHRALQALQDLGAGFDSGEIHLPASPENLGEILLLCSRSLRQEQEALLSGPGWIKTDNVFFHAKGAALAVSAILEGVEAVFGTALSATSTQAEIKRARTALREAEKMEPVVVLGSAGDLIRRNHLARLAAILGEADFRLNLALYRLPSSQKEQREEQLQQKEGP